jgi:ribonuclease HII
MTRLSVVYRVERLADRPAESDLYAGIDEVGVGSIAGPMMVAVVVLPEGHPVAGLPVDSKRLGPGTIQALAGPIEAAALFAWVGSLDADAVDALGASEARVPLWQAAVAALRAVLPGIPIVIDGAEAIPGVEDQLAIPHADESHDSVSAAAILAKSRCDRALAELDAAHPGYGLAKHKGYPTKEHLLAVQRLDPSPAHRGRSTERALRKGVPAEECQLPVDELRALLCEVMHLLNGHPELGDEWNTKFLRQQYGRVVQRGQVPSPRQQFFIRKAHGQIMKAARKRGLIARGPGRGSG